MRRRRLLLGLAPTFPALAGCTYAPGGGDLRGETTFPSPGDAPGGPLFSIYDRERFVTARSGRQWIRDDVGDLSFEIATTATVVDRAGTIVWRYRERHTSDRLAVGDRLYLVGEGRVTASPPVDPTATGVPLTGQVIGSAWEYPLEDRPDHLTVVGDTAVLSRGTELLGIRDGEENWTRGLPERIITVRRSNGAAIVHAGSEVLAIRPDGAIAWRQPAAPEPEAVAAGSQGVAIVGDEHLRFVLGGDVQWEESLGSGALVTLGEGALAVGVAGALEVRDLDGGARLATLQTRPGPQAVFVPGDGGGYLAATDGTVRALDAENGVRWRRSLGVDRDTRPLHGWLEPEAVALLCANGTIYRIQRQSAGRPLFL